QQEAEEKARALKEAEEKERQEEEERRRREQQEEEAETKLPLEPESPEGEAYHVLDRDTGLVDDQDSKVTYDVSHPKTITDQANTSKEDAKAEGNQTEDDTKEQTYKYSTKSMVKQASVGLAAVVLAVVGSYVYSKGPSAVANMATGMGDQGFDDGSYNSREEEDIETQIQLEEDFWAEGDDA
ncbi:200 kDa antigen p200, partial [Babesia divergens]